MEDYAVAYFHLLFILQYVFSSLLEQRFEARAFGGGITRKWQ